MRLDLHLTQRTKLPRHQVQKMIRRGLVRVGGIVCKKPSYKIQDSENVEYILPPEETFDLSPEEMPLDILYEDEAVAVVNKPADWVVHPAAGQPSHTLVNGLLHRYGHLPPGSDETKPGIVHRLDKGTSGCLIVARTKKAMESLQRQFKNREVEKTYLALVVGRPPAEGTVNHPIGRHPTVRHKMSTHTHKGREAETFWKRLETFGERCSLLEVKIKTGRTHQIRVHLSSIGHPLVGDPTYGRKNKIFKNQINHAALHAVRLKFKHPLTGKELCFEAPLPNDLNLLLKKLRQNKIEV